MGFFAHTGSAAYSSSFASPPIPTGEFDMPLVPRAAVAVLCSLVMGTVGQAQDSTPPPTPQQLAAMERVRPLVDAIWKDVRGPKETDQPRPKYFSEITDKL